MWGEGAEAGEAEDPTLECCRPLGIEIYSVASDALKDWKPPVPAFEAYKGAHGMKEGETTW